MSEQSNTWQNMKMFVKQTNWKREKESFVTGIGANEEYVVCKQLRKMAVLQFKQYRICALSRMNTWLSF